MFGLIDEHAKLKLSEHVLKASLKPTIKMLDSWTQMPVSIPILCILSHSHQG